MTNKIIGIVGSRRRDSSGDLNACLMAVRGIFRDGDSLVSGGCPRGGDNFAEIIAERYNIPIIIHYPDWDKYGRPAGLRRNGDIARDADVLVAVVADDRRGGTEDTIRKFRALGKSRVILV